MALARGFARACAGGTGARHRRGRHRPTARWGAL